MADIKMPAGADEYTMSPTSKVLDPETAPTKMDSNTVAINDETAHIVDKDAERKLCRKFDFRLLPVLAIMVCFVAIGKLAID
jgi:hypothetical protein